MLVSKTKIWSTKCLSEYSQGRSKKIYVRIARDALSTILPLCQNRTGRYSDIMAEQPRRLFGLYGRIATAKSYSYFIALFLPVFDKNPLFWAINQCFLALFWVYMTPKLCYLLEYSNGVLFIRVLASVLDHLRLTNSSIFILDHEV